MPASAARRAAFDILLRVEQEDAYAGELLHSGKFDRLSFEDRGLAYEIVMGVLRWRSRLDQQIALHSFTPMRKLDASVLTALRIGAYQLRYLDRVPAHAAVDESVELVKSAGKASAAGLANAVLRKISGSRSVREDTSPTLGAKNAPRMGHPNFNPSMAEEYAHPAWLVERWVAQFGELRARAICEFDQQRPVSHIRIRAGNEMLAILSSLRAEGIELTPGAILNSCWHVVAGDVTRTSAWKYRRIAIQDEGSQLVGELATASVKRPQRILDCCAAPGGKTMLLAEAHPEAHIVALELHPHRVETLKKLCAAPNVEIVQGDATRYQAAEGFDLVLADLPCSGTGTLARNPEIKWRLKPEKITELHDLQFSIARSALKLTRPGGMFVYSTCSLEAEENERVIERLVQERKCEAVPVAEVMPGLPLTGQYLRTVPGEQLCDGFFAAVLRVWGEDA